MKKNEEAKKKEWGKCIKEEKMKKERAIKRKIIKVSKKVKRRMKKKDVDKEEK